MVLAVASFVNDDAQATGDPTLLSPMLLNHRPSTPPLAEHHLLLDVPHGCLDDDDDDDASTATGRRVIDWASVRGACKEWVTTNPMNLALLLWLLCVVVSGGMLALLLLGLLDGAFPAPAERSRWVETNNQVLNALFTLMSLYQHPALCHHLFLLCRWRCPGDAAHLRAAYCKCKQGSAPAPRSGERLHMSVVVTLLHLTVACQYVLCGLYWGYTEPTARPELAEAGFFVLGVAAPLAAAVYTACSPLGRDDGHCHELLSSETTKLVAGHVVVVVEPEWAGGMFDCAGGGDGEASSSTWWWWCVSSLSCTFCVFGWNMERLGLGNACVHAATFALLCFAPLWVLGVSALHVHDAVVGDVVGGAGVLLCAGGLLYGGYWRIQMRRRFGLPGSTACCGSESLTDYARWLFCWPCALAQEVRTANLYHVDGEVLCSKLADDDHDVFRATDTVAVSQASPPANDHLVVVHDETMTAPPVQFVVVQVEDECIDAIHGEMSNSSVPATSAREEDDEALLDSNRAMAEDADRSVFSSSDDGSWRVEKVKKLINMVTLLSLLILLYTRGIIL